VDEDRYQIDLEDKYGQLNLIDIAAEVEATDHPWRNQTLTTVNDSVVRLGIIQGGDFHWHKHDDEDEFFLVLEGKLLIDVEDAETIELDRHQGVTIPRGVVHRPRAPGPVVILMVETASVVPTGDA
jgi:mannose-6-phosphate isomerase-like protein (cupin superfamily)